MKTKIICINCFDSPLSLKRNVRINRLITEVINYQADIICFQELIFLKRAKRISKMFEKMGYKTFFTPGKSINKGGLMLVTRYPILSSEYKKFKNQGTLFSNQLTDRFLKKGYQKILIEIDGEKIMVVNTHLASLYKSKSIKEKKVILKQFSELLNDLKKSKEKMIVAGDFNFQFTEDVYRVLSDETNLYDPLKEEDIITVSKENTQRKNFYKIKKNTRLDYILLSRDLRSTNFKLILKDLYRLNKKDVNLSDHYGLMMEVEG